MKGLLAKLKGMQYKQLLVNHGEKIAFGTVALIVLGSLAMTRWSGIDKKPEELTQKVESSKAALLNNPWPQEERKGPETPSTYAQYAAAMGRPLDYAGLAYNKPLSFPLYQKKPPISEPKWEPLDQLVTYSGRAVLAVQPPPEELELEEGADPTNPQRTPRNDRLGAGAGHAAGGGKSPMPTTAAGHGAGGPPGMPPMMDPMGMMRMQAGMMGADGATGITTRGQRYVSVVGVFNLYKQAKELQRAEGTETLQEALSLIEIYDFKLERQKAVPGPDPWVGKWEEVSLERADEILDETTDFALDVLPQIVQDPVMTMPLPQRLNGTWDKHASHPALKGYELSAEYKELQANVNAYLMTQEQALGGENGAEAETPRRGWSNKQTDMRGVENRLMQGGNMGEVNKGLGDYLKQMGGARGGHNAGGGTPMMPPGMMGMPMMPPGAPSGMGNRNMASMPMPGAGHSGRGGPPGMMPGMGMGSAGGMISADTLRYLLVFRYLDFDVNPNEAYRYRVKLLFTNPNFGLPLDQVKDQSVTEGETRESDWSTPSYPAIVEPDNMFNLVRVERSHRDAGKALLNLLNWDADKGTLINADLLVSLGSYLGGFAETEQLDMGAPSLEKTKDVAFVTRDLLVDTSFAPALVPAEHPDLKLEVKPNQANKPLDVGIPDQALVVNRYGQVVPIDKSESLKRISEAKKQVAEEREPFSYLVDLPEEGNRLDAAGGAPPGMMPGMMMPGMMMGGNPLRRGKGGRSGMMSPQQMMMQPSGAGSAHGSGGGNSKKKKTN